MRPPESRSRSESSTRESSSPAFDPSIALRPGDFDATVVLALWCLRKSFFPLLWLGLVVATLGVRDIDSLGTRIGDLADPEEIISSLLSPLAGVVLAIGVRLGVRVMATVAAYPITRFATGPGYTRGRPSDGFFKLWMDRLHMTRAYRSLRWTWVVRQYAAQRLGARGRIWQRAASWIRGAGPILFVVFLIVFRSAIG